MIGRLLRTGRALMVIDLAVIAEYRVTVFIWMLAGTLPLLMMLVWRHIAADGAIGGFDAAAFARYFLIAFLVQQIIQVWIIWNFDYAVRQGTLSIHLLRPLDPYVGEVVENLTANGFRLPVVLLTVATGLYLTDAYAALRFDRLPVFLLALALAWAIKFNLHFCLGILALWTERVRLLDSWSYMLMAALGGSLFPLELLPGHLRALVGLTPFPYIIDFPVSVLTRAPTVDMLVRGILVQVLWVAFFVAVHRILWHQGLKRFGAVGG